MLAILGVAINSITSIIPQLEPIPPTTSATSAPPQPNNMSKLEKAVNIFNSFIPIRSSNHFVKRAQYEDVVLAMWNKIYDLNRSPSKTEAQTNLIGTILLLLLSVIRTWKNNHSIEPMTLKIKRDEEGNKTAVDFVIPNGQWETIYNYGQYLSRDNKKLICDIDNERTASTNSSGFSQFCSGWLKNLKRGYGGRKSRKARRTRKSRRPKRRTRRAKK